MVQTIDLREGEQCLCDGGGHTQFSMVVLALWMNSLALKMNSLERINEKPLHSEYVVEEDLMPFGDEFFLRSVTRGRMQ